ncbi:MAG TPA: class I SAM-dependent methyltransferase [Pseudoxanthomonas sp.]|nr:class I SAM-dependent methyltransferase [Pseudoxanthomonas sp.]
MSALHDPALETLLLPFASGELAWPDAPALFLRARDGWALRQFPLQRLVCEQSFKPDADALARSGLEVVEAASPSSQGFPLVLVLPPRQRDEMRALFARAVSLVAPGGIVVACMANDEGAKSGEGDLQKLAGLGGKLTKNHCRVFWTPPLNGVPDAELLAQWLHLDAQRSILDGRFVSRPGVFAWDRIDVASALLAECLPRDFTGVGADLGAGYGFLSSEILARSEGVSALHLYEAEARALDCAKINLAPFADTIGLDFRWHDVAAGLPESYDFIVTNPPFHTTQKAGRPDIGQRFIAVAAQGLKPGGRLWLVANRHLPYEQVLNANFGSVRVAAERDGFKAIEAVKSR